MNDGGCPHCQNQINIVFGTCYSCGWNHLDNSFHFVRVSLEDVPYLDPYLVAKHAARTMRDPESTLTPLKE